MVDAESSPNEINRYQRRIKAGEILCRLRSCGARIWIEENQVCVWSKSKLSEEIEKEFYSFAVEIVYLLEDEILNLEYL